MQAQQTVNSSQEAERQASVALENANAQGTNAVPIQNQAIAAARATFKSAQAQEKLLQTEIAQTSLTAPFDGVITQRLLDPGAYAGPNQPILQISQIAHVYVNVNVPDEDLGVRSQQTRRSRSPRRAFRDARSPGRFTTSTRRRRRARSPTARASIMPNPDDSLRGGMLVAVNVRKAFSPGRDRRPDHGHRPEPDRRGGVHRGQSTPRRRAEPRRADPRRRQPERNRAGRRAAASNSRVAKLVPVTLGLQTDTTAQVTSPQITAGTTIITTRPDALQDKSLVAFAPNAPAGGASRGAQSPEGDAP